MASDCFMSYYLYELRSKVAAGSPIMHLPASDLRNRQTKQDALQ